MTNTVRMSVFVFALDSEILPSYLICDSWCCCFVDNSTGREHLIRCGFSSSSSRQCRKYVIY